MKPKIAAVFAGAVLLVVLGLATTFWFFNQTKEAADERKHTFVLLNDADDLMAAMVNAETGQRGFLLTGDEVFLKPYLAVHNSISGNLQKIRQQTLIPAAQQHLDALASLIDAKLAHLSHNIELRRNNDTTAAIANVRGSQGNSLMNSIRAEMHSFVQIEEDALAQHDAEYQSNLHILFIFIMGFCLAALLSVIAFAYFIHRQTQQRIMNQVHVHTAHLLESEQESNKQLQQVNATLQVSEEKLAITLNSIGDAVIATDAEARVMLMNPLAEQLTGWTQAEASGRPVDDIFHIINKETRHLATIPVFDALEHGTIQGLANHTVLIARDGLESDVADSCSPIRDRDGHVVGAVLVFRDVTGEYALQHTLSKQRQELEKQNEELRENEERFRTLADNISQLAWMGDAQGSLFWYNQRWFDYTGTTLEEMHGWGWQKVHHPDHEQRVVEKFKHCLETGELWEDTFPLRGADGQYRWFLSRALPILDEHGIILRWFGTNTDITEHKQIEVVQNQVSQYARSLIEASLDPLVTINAQGKITDVNESSVQATGVPRKQLIGTDFLDYFTDPTKAREGYQRVFSEGFVRDYPLALRHVDGQIMDVLYNASVYKDDNGNVPGVFAAARDVTKQKLLDQQLREKNTELESSRIAAETANIAKSEFLSHMSHELRTPLNAILGFSQLLETGTPSPTPDQMIKLNQILKAGWYLLDLINEILDLALIESGKSSMSLEPVSLSKVLLECQAMFVPQAEENNIHLHFHMFDSAWFVHADQTKLKQVLTNLLSNAIKYNRENGTVDVKCSENTQGCLRISVKDSGNGLSAEKLAQLFQPFNRLGQEIGVKEGTGIGLALSKKLVGMMGGTIGVESTVGVGSEFWIELDRDVPSQPVAVIRLPEERDSQRKKDVARYTLLYVEDNPANLMLVEQIIEGHPNIRMLSAHDGAQGIALAREQQPDIILMDINLPGISGIEAMILLRKDPATKHIPIIALSANAMLRDIDKGLEAGLFRYLTKPIKINEFTEALDAVMASVGKKQPPA